MAVVGADRKRGIDSIVAAVLTYRRPRLAGQVVRTLIGSEGFQPRQILLIINGDGGLDDPSLENAIRVVRLPENVGPAGGFGSALQTACADPGVHWVYLCEDDVGLFNLPSPRVARVVQQAEQLETKDPGRPIGAIVSYGWDVDRRTGHGSPRVVHPGAADLTDVDAAAWGATLVSRRVVDAGVLPDEDYFIDYEDFDFFYRLHDAGFRILLDEQTAVAASDHHMTNMGRDAAFEGQRPNDMQEPWRAYYVARNFFFLNRTHGRPRWLLWHFIYTVRRLQLANSAAARHATVRGLWDGLRDRRGKNPAFERQTGELSSHV